MKAGITQNLASAVISALLCLVVAAPAFASAPEPTSTSQEFDLGSDVSGYRRFLIYPHLQKGWESMQRGDRDRALMEFERARALAPESVVVALHLANAYRKFGESARAESVLRQQLERTPRDARLRNALMDFEASGRSATRVPPGSVCPDPSRECTGGSASDVRPAGGPPPAASEATRGSGRAAKAEPGARDSATRVRPTFSAREQPGSDPPEGGSHSAGDAGQSAVSEPNAFTRALQSRRFDDAQHLAERMLVERPGDAALLDEVTYQMVEAGATTHATRMLLSAYPFETGTPDARDRLFQRFLLLIKEQPGVLTSDDLAPLRVPLNTPALRSRQAMLWTSLRDCDVVRAVLGDMSPAYTHDDWMRLGDCVVSNTPALAEQAYTRAHELQPGGAGSRALGYQAYAAGHYHTALTAWRSVGDRLSGDELLGASATALAAGDNEQAATWIGRYRESGGTLNHRYFSLLADICMARTDRAAAEAALEQAIELQPDPGDYLRLAALQSDPERQVGWLERAAKLYANNVAIQAELGFAYRRAGKGDAARLAWEHAAALDPNNVNVQLALGYLYWDTGRASQAQSAFQRVWTADPGNLAAAEQLVYVDQRLHANDEARWFAEHVLDAMPSSGNAGTNEDANAALANRRFGLQRLHEDLGRRLTVTLDGWSGSGVGTGTSASQVGSRYSSFSQLEAEYRLGKDPVRNGTTLAAYARVLADGGAERRAAPSENPVLGMGLRWKPWGRQVIYLAAEVQTSLEGPVRREVLLRSSASFFNGGRFGDDWHPSGRGWFARNLYLDGAHYVQSGQSAFTADFRSSYHAKVASSQTLEPYGHFQVNGLRNDRFARDVRFGVGSRWNIWYGGTRYNADPHKLSLGVEFQQALETYLPDRHGLFVSLSARW